MTSPPVQYFAATLLLLNSVIPFVQSGATKENMYDCYDSVLNTTIYKKRVRPVIDSDTALDVEMQMALIAIAGLDEQAQTFSISTTLSMRWNDAHLTWSKSQFGQLETIHTDQDDIWLPDIVVGNSANKREQLGYKKMPVRIDFTGDITWEPTLMITSSCDIDVTYYPYDTQLCTIVFTTDISDYGQIDVNLDPDMPIEMVYFSEDGTWDIIGYAAKELPNGPMKPMIGFTFLLKRRPKFFFDTIILPVLILSTTAPLVFLLPVDAGEKCGVSITVLLAFAVYLTLVTDYLPSSSTSSSVFAQYLTSLLAYTTISVVASVLILRMHIRKTQVGRRIVRFTKIIRLITFNRPDNQIHSDTRPATMIAVTPLSDTKPRTTDRDIPDKDGCCGLSSIYTDDTLEWEDVAEALDWFFFLAMSLTILVTTLITLFILLVESEMNIPQI